MEVGQPGPPPAWGSVSQVASVPYFLAASFWAQAGGQYSPGTAGYPVDSVTTYAVNGNAYGSEVPGITPDSVRAHDATDTANGILSHAEWAKFKTSNCAVVLGNIGYGLPSMWHNARYPWDPNMIEVQRAQSELRFYDTGNPYWANMPLNKVLPAAYAKYNDLFTMGQYLTDAKASAATPVLGAPGPIPLAPGFFQQKKPQVTLIHEVLIHAYAGVSDTQVENSSYFRSQHYWFDGVGSATISSWMSTDCTCTPENPDNQKNDVTCNANTAKW